MRKTLFRYFQETILSLTRGVFLRMLASYAYALWTLGNERAGIYTTSARDETAILRKHVQE